MTMNGQFRFRLERVRALRERHEDAAKEALAFAILYPRQMQFPRDLWQTLQRYPTVYAH